MPWPADAFGDVEVGRDRRQQADRHEFGGDQREHAQRHGEDAAPERREIRRVVLGRRIARGRFECRGRHGFLRCPAAGGARRPDESSSWRMPPCAANQITRSGANWVDGKICKGC